ncbi:MAG: AbrB/MazE/SpoVT family DNA-binding domain-containing protein [Candidatus Bathyarchaeia archaeon]
MGIKIFSGIKMETVKVDEKGRIIIPKSIREKAGLKEGSHVKIKVDEKVIVIEPLEPIADKYFGAFKITKWPKNLDEFVIEVMRKWWIQKAT